MYINILTNVSRETFSSKSRIIANLTSRFTRPAPAPPPQKSELGRRTPSTPPQTTAPPQLRKVRNRLRQSRRQVLPTAYPHPTATPPYSTQRPHRRPIQLRRRFILPEDHDLGVRMKEPHHGQPIGRGENAVLSATRHRPPKSARLSPIGSVVRVPMQSQQGNGRRRISRRSRES